ncbi:alpha-amylase family glycosyl hydrolase [Limibacter armeniacum]|uniref:alpha-amylase family glycosyl hydrolase n=1 Tax=Limibacter armeniacum TaxID=466084 RepID=UPI002FE55E47
MRKKILLGIAFFLCIPVIQGLCTDVKFNVNMDYQIKQGFFDPAADQVEVTGSGWSGALAMTDTDGDHIYSAVVSSLAADTEITYAFRVNASNTENTSRTYLIQTSQNNLYDWFNNVESPYPFADFYCSTTTPIPGEAVRFFEYSDGGAATSWNWTFEGGYPATSTEKEPIVSYATAGTYSVTLTATNSAGQTTVTKSSHIEVKATDQVLGWWNDAVFYQVYPLSFKDSDCDGNGDFQGLIEKLDYLNDGNPNTTSDLGVDALYLMPIHEVTNTNYGGYEVTDYKSIWSEYGSYSDLSQLLNEAHNRGMKVILDMVFNHTSKEHPWFLQSQQGNNPRDDFYHWRADDAGWSWWSNPGSGYPSDMAFYWSRFANGATPDLNYDNPEVRNAVMDITQYWLDQHIDGFRLDVPYMLYQTGDATLDEEWHNLPETYAFWREWRKLVKNDNPDNFTVGETWVRYWDNPYALEDLKHAAKYVYEGFDVGFQFDIALGIEDALNSENKADIQQPMEDVMAYYPFLQFGVFNSNHDLFPRGNGYTAQRIKDRLSNNKDAKAKVAGVLTLTAPGVPFVYYGEEIGAAGGNARLPMQWSNGNNAGFSDCGSWTSIGSDYQQYNVANETNDPNSFLSLYRNLIQVRKSEMALKRGDYQTVNTSSNSIYSFMRKYNDEVIIVMLNLSANQQDNVSFSISGTQIPDENYVMTDLLGQGNVNVNVSGGDINGWVPFSSIAGNSFYILKLNTGSLTNNAPSVDQLASQTINLESGATQVQLTGISDGNFCTQSLSASATIQNTSVAQVAVNGITCGSTGNLTITPVSAGTTTVTVTLQDDGGTADGGVDQTSMSFTVNVIGYPAAPTDLQVTELSKTSLNLHWTDNSAIETGYAIYQSTDGNKPTNPVVTLAANTTTFAVENLSRFVDYHFWVEAVNGQGTSADMQVAYTIESSNVALNKTATASDEETYSGTDFLASLAVDGINGDFWNRWSSAGSTDFNQEEWIKVDLGAVYELDKVVVSWENANAENYYIMASNSNIVPDPDNSSWQKIYMEGMPNEGRTDEVTSNLTGRYIAIYCSQKAHEYGYSIYELEAYGVPVTDGGTTNNAPVVFAGNNQTLGYTQTSTQLEGTGSDPDGDTVSYLWSQLSGAVVSISDLQSPTPTISGMVAGNTYTFRLTVSDGTLQSSDDVTIVVDTAPATQSPYGGIAATIPGIIEAEAYDEGGQGIAYQDNDTGNNGGAFRTNEDVDIESPTSGVYNVGWTQAGEWLEYSVNVTTTGQYHIISTVATATSSAFHVEIDGTNVTGTIAVSNTGGWSNFSTVQSTDFNLSAGAHIVRIAMESIDLNLDKVEFVWVPDCTTPTLNAQHQVNGGNWIAGTAVSADQGDDLVLNVQASTTGTWNWTGPNGFTASTAQVTLADVTISDAGNYTVTFSDDTGCTNSLTFTLSVESASVADTYYIKNRWQETYLYDGGNDVNYGTFSSNATYQWKLIEMDGYQLIQNVGTGDYMNIENLQGKVESTNVESGFYSAHWSLEDIDIDYKRIRNRWQASDYLHVENTNGTVEYSNIWSGSYSSHWILEPVSSSARMASNFENEWKKENKIQIYPNPTNGVTTVQFNTNEVRSIRLLSSTGIELNHQQLEDGMPSIQIDLSNYPVGVYFIQLETSEGVKVYQVVKN